MSENPWGPPSEEPRWPLELAANAAIDAIANALGNDDVQLVIAIAYKDGQAPDDDQPPAATAGHGFDDPRDTFAFLIAHAASLGKALGLDIRIVPIPNRMGQG